MTHSPAPQSTIPLTIPTPSKAPSSVIHWVCAGTYNGWQLFSDSNKADIVTASFQSSEALQRNRLLAWALLPDQAQWLIQLATGERLESCISRLKAISSRDLNHYQGGRAPIWDIAFEQRQLEPGEDSGPLVQRMQATSLGLGLNRFGASTSPAP